MTESAEQSTVGVGAVGGRMIAGFYHGPDVDREELCDGLGDTVGSVVVTKGHLIRDELLEVRRAANASADEVVAAWWSRGIAWQFKMLDNVLAGIGGSENSIGRFMVDPVVLEEMERDGWVLRALCHSHPGSGRDAIAGGRAPSGVDMMMLSLLNECVDGVVRGFIWARQPSRTHGCSSTWWLSEYEPNGDWAPVDPGSVAL